MMSEAEPPLCLCYNARCHFAVFDEKSIGTEPKYYGEVCLLTCKHCQTIWPQLLLENEAFTASGRYYRGLIDKTIAKQVTPATAIAVLESLDWCFYGGSWFNHAGKRSQCPVKVSFM